MNIRIYLHKKSGGHYRLINIGKMEGDLSPVVVYTDYPDSNQVWVRPYMEFFDKFEALKVIEEPRTDLIEDVLQFHKKFGLAYTGLPRALPSELLAFRGKFLQEELDEYMKATLEAFDETTMAPRHRSSEHYANQLANALDALVDLVYVALGTAHLHGFDFTEAWCRVHQANMTKIRAERPEDSKRGSSFDVVKPEGWQPPDHTDLVKNHDLFKDL